LIENGGIFAGTGFWLMLNILFIAMEYKINPEFRDWFNSTVRVGIEQVERQLYKK